MACGSYLASQNLIHNLNLPKDAAEVLKANNLLSPKPNFSWYRHHERDLTSYFFKSTSMVYCKGISGMICWFGVHYNASDGRMFIDSSQSGLKGVLLHTENVFASIPVAHSIHLREIHDSLKHLLNSVSYKEHGWLVCGDFKVTVFLLGVQVGYIKLPCFLCEWDSRAKSEHWERHDLPSKDSEVD
jgi:hypothetical protein